MSNKNYSTSKVVQSLFLFSLVNVAFPIQSDAANPTYPIIADVQTTRQRTVSPTQLTGVIPLTIDQVDQYAPIGYSSWGWGSPVNYGPQLPDGTVPPKPVPAETLLSFFTISDIHIIDKESPSQAIYGTFTPPYTGGLGKTNTSSYSPIMLSTTHVLDAAVQTINALHRNPGPDQAPFDFGISLGDDANNNQYNELRWFIDVMDGKRITPSSGAHKGAGSIDYQKPYQSAGLDKSIPWYQTIGNHDQYWCGTLLVDDYDRKTLTGNTVMDMGVTAAGFPTFDARGIYAGIIDGTTEYGTITGMGSTTTMMPPMIAADPRRHALATSTSTSLNWMKEFFKTTSKPKGHGFTQANLDKDFASYTFEPKANVPLKVIVLDDTCKTDPYAAESSYARGCLDQARYDWLVGELTKGQDEGKLMIITAHVPVGPQSNVPDNPVPPGGPANNMPLPALLSQCMDGVSCSPAPGYLENYVPLFPYNIVTDYMLLAKLHEFPNLLLWIAGHRHLNTVTPQPSPDPAHPELGFWEVETPSLRDFPQQFRTFKIVRNTNNTVSIFVTDVDPAVQEDPATTHASLSPAAKSRGYAIGADRISVGGTFVSTNIYDFNDTTPHVYNAELIKPLAAPYNMWLQVTGTGQGSVVSAPYSGINCSSAATPCSVNFLPNTTVSLEATPAPGSVFASWTPCARKGACTILMDRDIAVNVSFTQDPTLVVTPDYKTFGVKKVGTKSIATFTVRNTATKGVKDLIIGSIDKSETVSPAQFTLVTGKDHCSGKTIPSGKSCTFQLSFKPTSADTKIASVSIPSNDPDQPVTIQITGAGK